MESVSGNIVSACGEVVEILEQEGDLHVKVVLRSPTILDVVAEGVNDLHLGDQVIIDGRFTVGRVRKGSAQAAPSAP